MADKKNKLLDELQGQNASLPFQTNLTLPEQLGFAKWAESNQVPVDLSVQSDYDMPGFYKALQAGKASSGVSPLDNRVHYTDQFKTPQHQTFSKESQYAPEDAPHWEGNALRSPSGDLQALELPNDLILNAKLKALKNLK